jgi:DNA-binding beta-propeller fold protein YncE
VPRILVTSASGPNGNGYGALLSFGSDGSLVGEFCKDDRISDPRGLSHHPIEDIIYLNSGDDRVLGIDYDGVVSLDTGRIEGLDPGGGVFGPDGRYYITLRSRRTILSFPADLSDVGTSVLPDRIVPFPRGFGFGPDRQLYLSSGIGPAGDGDNTIAVFSNDGTTITSALVHDTELSPLDMAVAPNGNIVVSSEWPFGDPSAHATVREYSPSTGDLVRVLSPPPMIMFSRPRGLRFVDHDRLYCVGEHDVVSFQFSTGAFVGVVAHLRDLNGQALVVIP